MSDADFPRMSFTERAFSDSLRADGSLSESIDEAVPGFIYQHQLWFQHAVELNHAGLAAYNRRDSVITGLSSQHPISLSMRMMYRTLSAYQGALILYRRGMIAEGNTLARNVYETAFWLGFIQQENEVAVRALVNDELMSQKDQANYFLDKFKNGSLSPNPMAEKDLNDRITYLKSKTNNADKVSVKKAAERGGLYDYYGTYKKLSASSAHNSLNSLHRYLKKEDGSYDGHIVGPDPDGLTDSLPDLCVGLGVALAMFCTIIPMGSEECELKRLLLKADALEKSGGKANSQ